MVLLLAVRHYWPWLLASGATTLAVASSWTHRKTIQEYAEVRQRAKTDAAALAKWAEEALAKGSEEALDKMFNAGVIPRKS
jgi:hypothetical protein